jgi:mono/diheme cytochrome c family protein
MDRSLFAALVMATALTACGSSGTPTAMPAQTTAEKSADWQTIVQQRSAEHQAYLEEQQEAYRWFADFPMGINDGVPYLILKVLPKLAPEFWGSEENFLDVVGLFNDERLQGYPIARGFGWSGMAREGDQLKAAVDFASFTCGACHIGRVKTDNGFAYLDGGVNAEFNLPQYRVRAMKTVSKITANAANQTEKIGQATQAIIAAIEKVHAQDKNFFYQNYQLGSKVFDADYEANQIVLFKQKAAAIVGGFIGRTSLEYQAFGALLAKNYPNHVEPMLTGFGGMADATGVSTSFGYMVRKAKGEGVDPATDLPPTQGITDFMVVWEQDKRKVRWSPDHSQLIEGGGQWNGNIPIPMFRNMAAELTMGFGAKTDLRVAAFAQTLLENLPAPVYPFDVDMVTAKQGEQLYQKNCATCHQPHNGQVYTNMGTNLGRAFIASQSITEGARGLFTAICSPTTVLDMPGGQKQTPCAEFEGQSLVGKSQFAMMDPTLHEGYNALPLGGVWAQAPYLHNGSVPTMSHLLLPKTRPTTFIKSRLEYDQQMLGFAWRPSGSQSNGYLYDTQGIKAFSNAGHDQDIKDGELTYKLDWSDDKAGAMAIIEYMKTL